MQPHEFTFELALPAQTTAGNETIVGDLATVILTYAGYPPDAVGDVIAAMRKVVTAAGRQPCEVAFRAHDGQLHIALRRNGAAAWETTRPLP